MIRIAFAGILFIVLILAVSSCSGTGDRELAYLGGPYAGPDFDGGWTGDLTMADAENSTFRLSVNQAGKNYTGDILVEGPAEFLSGELRGTIQDDGSFAFAVLTGGETTATFVGSVNGATITGTWANDTQNGTFAGQHS